MRLTHRFLGIATIAAGMGLASADKASALNIVDRDIADGETVTFVDGADIFGNIGRNAKISYSGKLRVRKNIGGGATLEPLPHALRQKSESEKPIENVITVDGRIDGHVTLKGTDVSIESAGDSLTVDVKGNFKGREIGRSLKLTAGGMADFASAGDLSNITAAFIGGGSIGYKSVVRARVLAKIVHVGMESAITSEGKILAHTIEDYVSLNAGSGIAVTAKAGAYALMHTREGNIEIDGGSPGEENEGQCLRRWFNDETPRLSLAHGGDLRADNGSIIVHTAERPAELHARDDVIVRYVPGMDYRQVNVHAGGRTLVPYTCTLGIR